jgi:hypothetical protein
MNYNFFEDHEKIFIKIQENLWYEMIWNKMNKSLFWKFYLIDLNLSRKMFLINFMNS